MPITPQPTSSTYPSSRSHTYISFDAPSTPHRSSFGSGGRYVLSLEIRDCLSSFRSQGGYLGKVSRTLPFSLSALQTHFADDAHALFSRFWLLTTVLDLWKIYTKTPRRSTADEHAREDLQLQAETRSTTYKLLSDLVFVCESLRSRHDAHTSSRRLGFESLLTTQLAYDVFHLTWIKEPVQCGAGLVSAFISTGKLYDQHWTASLGKG